MTPLLTLPQAAAALNISRRTLEREIAAGKLPAIAIRGGRRIAMRDLEDYIARARHYAEAIACPSTNVVTFGGSASRSGDNALRNLLAEERAKRTRKPLRPASAATTLQGA